MLQIIWPNAQTFVTPGWTCFSRRSTSRQSTKSNLIPSFVMTFDSNRLVPTWDWYLRYIFKSSHSKFPWKITSCIILEHYAFLLKFDLNNLTRMLTPKKEHRIPPEVFYRKCSKITILKTCTSKKSQLFLFSRDRRLVNF